MRDFRNLTSTTTVDTTCMTESSREFPSGPEDPFWDSAVARVKERVRQEQEKERREQKAAAKAEQKIIRSVSREREGRLKWAKQAIDMLIGKHDEHGWLPKKDPKDFDDDDWNFVMEILNHKDTRALRDRLFKQPQWVEANKRRERKYLEEMRINPTPEFLAAKQAQKDKEHKEYSFRKVLGLLTEDEKERERLLAESPSGLGITMPSRSGSSQTPGLQVPKVRGRPLSRPDVEVTPSKTKEGDDSFSSLVRTSAEEMTNVFNTEGFNPRLSRLGSEEVKQRVQRTFPDFPRSDPRTPTPHSSSIGKSLNSRQRLGHSPSHIPMPAKRYPAQQQRTVRKAASSNELSQKLSIYRQPTYRGKGKGKALDRGSKDLPTVRVHPALRGSEATSPSPEAHSTISTPSRIPTLRKVNSSIGISRIPTTPGGVRRQYATVSSTGPEQHVAALRAPPKQSRPSLVVEEYIESDTSYNEGFTSSHDGFSQMSQVGNTPKTAPLQQSIFTSPNTGRSASGPAAPLMPVRAPPAPPTVEKRVGSAPGISTSTLDRPHRLYDSHDPPPNPKRSAEAGSQSNPSTGPQDRAKETKTPSPPLAPRDYARLSQIPLAPDASDFMAAAFASGAEVETRSSSLPIITPRDRLTAKRSGDPAPSSSTSTDEYSNEFSTSPGSERQPLTTLPPRLDSLQWNPRVADSAEDKGKASVSPSNASQTPDIGIASSQGKRRLVAPAATGLPKPTQDAIEDTERASHMQHHTEGVGSSTNTAALGTPHHATSSPSPLSYEYTPSRAEGKRKKSAYAQAGQTEEQRGNDNQPRSMLHGTSGVEQTARSLSENVAARDRGKRVIPDLRSVSQATGTSNIRTPTGVPHGGGPESQPLRQSIFEPISPVMPLFSQPGSRRGSNPSGRRSSSRRIADDGTTRKSSARAEAQGRQADTSNANISIREIINAWQQSSPAPTTPQSPDSQGRFQDQEIQTLRSETGLEPICEHMPGDPEHPDHSYAWNTKKVMCRRIHNPAVILPALPSPALDQPVRMSDYPSEYFIGTSYTDEPSDPEHCAHCNAFCCFFADAVSRLETRDPRETDIVRISGFRRLNDLVANLKVKKPNGIEEWSAFLRCSQCERRFCPDCITLCSESMCQEPVCVECQEGEHGTELCRIHNVL